MPSPRDFGGSNGDSTSVAVQEQEFPVPSVFDTGHSESSAFGQTLNGSWQHLRKDRHELQVTIDSFLSTQRRQLEHQRDSLKKLENLSVQQKSRFEDTLKERGFAEGFSPAKSAIASASPSGASGGAGKHGSRMDRADTAQSPSSFQVTSMFGQKRVAFTQALEGGNEPPAGLYSQESSINDPTASQHGAAHKEMFLSLEAKTNTSLLYHVAILLGIGALLDKLWICSAKKRLPGCISRASTALAEAEWFKTMSTIVIVINAVFIAISADDYAKRSISQWRTAKSGEPAIDDMTDQAFYLDVADITFGILFTIEWIVRVCADEMLFWVGEEWQWNFMDTIAVLSAWMDVLLQMADMTFLRLFRVLRVLRTLRVIRVLRFFRELRVMLLSLLGSIMSLAWAMLCLAMIIFVFSIFFVQGVSNFIQDSDGGNPEAVTLIEMFNSFSSTFLTLFYSVTGGCDWSDVHKPLEVASFFYGNLFLMYVSVMVFGVLNVITGIFVESATARARNDKDLATEEELSKSYEMMKQLMLLFEEVDENMSGSISYDEWENFCGKPEAQACFSLLDIDVSKTKDLFKMIDTDMSSEVDLEEFVMSCMKLSGAAKAVDLEAMLQNNKKLVISCTTKIAAVSDEIKEALASHLGQTVALFGTLQSELSSKLQGANNSEATQEVTQAVMGLKKVTAQLLNEQTRAQALPVILEEQVMPSAPISSRAGIVSSKQSTRGCSSNILSCV